MTVKPGAYTELLSFDGSRWKSVKGEPRGVDEVLLNRHGDGSYTHLLRVEKGVEYSEPVTHDFHEVAYYIDGEMLNKKTGKKIRAGTYVYHEPGEEHGPFKCLRTCLILEFRYYK